MAMNYEVFAKKLQIEKILDEIARLWMKIELWTCDICYYHIFYSICRWMLNLRVLTTKMFYITSLALNKKWKKNP